MSCPPNCPLRHYPHTYEKETAVACDVPPICEDPTTCKWCNPEPLTLEGDIRYLKAHIETKDRQLADANKRVEIYREAMLDAAREGAILLEENERLRKEIALLNTHKARYQEEILQLEQEAETYRLALNKVRVIIEEIGFE